VITTDAPLRKLNRKSLMFHWFSLSFQYALLGGVLIGLAAAMLIVLNGKIAGISGILGGLFSPAKESKAWRILFIIGLIASPWVYQLFAPLPVVEVKANTLILIISGLLVGFGTQLGNGCTSGHGVCGIARLSIRSVFATLTFILFGVITVYFMRVFS